jgi:hypothetical protein
MQYGEQTEQNEKMFRNLLKQVRPTTYMLLEEIDQTGINVMVLIKILRQLHSIATGLKYGEVRVQIEKGEITFIKGEHSDRVYQPVIDQEQTLIPNDKFD